MIARHAMPLLLPMLLAACGTAAPPLSPVGSAPPVAGALTLASAVAPTAGEEAAWAQAKRAAGARDLSGAVEYIRRYHDGRFMMEALMLIRNDYSVAFECEQGNERRRLVGYFSNPCRNGGGRTVGVTVSRR